MDLNGDGQRDILSGSYSRMGSDMAGLFQVLWGEADGQFKQTSTLNGTDREPLIIPVQDKSELTEKICTRPYAVDWDGDGQLDLVVGNFAGTFWLFRGEGKGRFAPKPESLKAGTERLRIRGQHGDPFAVDWDGDGDIDLVSGSSEGGVQWSENTAGRGRRPALQQFKPLIEPGRRFQTGELVSEADLTAPSGSTRVWVEDVNGDGKLDVLVGDTITLVSMAKGVTRKEYDRQFGVWKKEWDAASKAYNAAFNEGGDVGSDEKEAARKRFNEVYQRRTTFMQEDPTGYVWLYRRK